MKLLIAMVLIPLALHGQMNLVSNPGFEDFTACPTTYNQISYCLDWSGVPGCMNISDVADYFQTCSTTGFAPPAIATGWQQTHSGDAFCGISTSSTVVNNCHEYCQNKLLDTLVPGRTYDVSFYANLAGASFFSLASNKLGALFTTYEIGNQQLFPSQNFAHVYSDSVITDTAGWFLVQGSFVADSFYTYMTIGNFFDDAHTTRLPLNGNSRYAWYYIDDVSVTQSDSNNGMSEFTRPYFSIYPNPAATLVTIHGGLLKPQSKFQIGIVDLTGKQVYPSIAFVCHSGEEDFNLPVELDDGLYFIRISGESVHSIVKLFVKHPF